MSKSVFDLKEEAIDKYNTKKNTFEKFPIGVKVKIVTPCEDFHFYYGETGTVIKNSGQYLGISVKYDVPREYTDGTIEEYFNFNPKSLCLLEKVELFEKPLTEEIIRDYISKKESKRFEIMDL